MESGVGLGGGGASNEFLTHHMLTFHLMPWSRGNGVDLNPAFLEHTKWMESASHDLMGFISSQKLEGQVWNPHLPLSLSEQFPPLSISIFPCGLQSIFSSLPLTFSFLSSSAPIYPSILSSTLSLNPAILLTFQFHSSSISRPFLYLSSAPGLGCNSACFRAS